MKLSKLVDEVVVIEDSDRTDKRGLFMKIAESSQTFQNYHEKYRESVVETLLERERLGATAINDCVCFPHARIEGLEVSIFILVVLRNGVDWKVKDGGRCFFMVLGLVPVSCCEEYLKRLAYFAHFLSQTEIVQDVIYKADREKIVEYIRDYEGSSGYS